MSDIEVRPIPLATVSEILSKCRDQCLYGRYKEALADLDPYLGDEALDTGDRVAILRAAARVFVSMGYSRTARECIRKALLLPWEGLDPEQSLGLQIHDAFVTLVACGEDIENESVLEHGYKWLADVQVEALFESDKLDMENYLHRIALVRQTLHQKKGQDVKPGIAQRLKLIMSKATETGRFDVNWTLFEPYSGAIGIKPTIHWLSELLEKTTHMPDVVRGLLNLELASRLGEQNMLHDCAKRLSNAEEALEKCSHAIGKLEIRRYRLRYELVSHENVLEDLIRVVAEYCDMDYPLGVLRATTFPLQRAFDIGDFRTYINLQRVLHEVCKTAGIVYERLLLEIQLLAAMNAATGRHGKVMELGLTLYDECRQRNYWTLAFQVAQVISLAEKQVDNLEEGCRWAALAFDLCKEHDMLSETTAAYNLAHALSFKKSLQRSDALARSEKIVSLLEPYAEQDVQDKEIRMACEKLSLLATTWTKLARDYQGDKDTWMRKAHAIWGRIDVLARDLEGTDQVLVQGACEEARVIQLLYEGKCRQDYIKEDEAIERLDALIARYKDHKLFIYEAIKYQMKGMCNIQKWQKVAHIDNLKEAEACLLKACQKFQALSSMQFFLGCRHRLCQLYVEAYDLEILPLENTLRELEVLETIADTIRRELSAMRGLQALLQKQHFAAWPSIKDLYDWAVGICSRAEDATNLWVWSHKRKARSLSDMLGLGVIMPAATVNALKSEPAARQCFEAWRRAQDRLASVPENERGYVRQEIEDYELQLQGFSSFKSYAVVRDGILEGFHQATSLHIAFGSSSSSREIHLVDWVIFRNDIFMLLTKCGSSQTRPKLQKLKITVSQVDEWITRHFESDENRKDCLIEDSVGDDDSPMRGLDALIAPLQEGTGPGDLLICSPSGSLFAIPLHALKVYTKESSQPVPLIVRNPILYTPSFTVLKTCLEKSEGINENGYASFLSSFDHAGEEKAIAQQMSDLSKPLRGRHASGVNVTKTAFGNLTSKARLIHFHGHCRFSARNILKQSLVLTPEQQHVAAFDEERILDKSGIDTDFRPEKILNPSGGRSERKLGHRGDSEVSMASLESPNPPSLPTTMTPSPANGNVDEKPLLLSSDDDDIDTQNHLTLEEIFRLPLSPALIVLVACSSSSQSISIGDEPMGLISGLLCAGAASVVGSSWAIPSLTGRIFSASFYEAFVLAKQGCQDCGDSGSFIDLAVILQSAVKKMMDKKNLSTYDWAAFSLWGNWKFRSDLLVAYEDIGRFI